MLQAHALDRDLAIGLHADDTVETALLVQRLNDLGLTSIAEHVRKLQQTTIDLQSDLEENYTHNDSVNDRTCDIQSLFDWFNGTFIDEIKQKFGHYILTEKQMNELKNMAHSCLD